MVEMRELRAMVEPLGRRIEAESGTQETGGGDKGTSSHNADGDWQTHGDPTAQMVG